MNETATPDDAPRTGQGPTTFATPRPAPGGAGGADEVDGLHRRRWRRHKLIAFFLGGLVGGIAATANLFYGLTVAGPFALAGEGAFLLVLVAVVAPVVEEHVKLLALVLLRAEERATYTPGRWLVLGAFAGAGFGVAEAILYWQNLAVISFSVANLNLAVRALLTVPLHALTVSITGYGYGMARRQDDPWHLVRALAVAILIHAAFNAYQTVAIAGVLGWD